MALPYGPGLGKGWLLGTLSPVKSNFNSQCYTAPSQAPLPQSLSIIAESTQRGLRGLRQAEEGGLATPS